jgi:allantoicase
LSDFTQFTDLASARLGGIVLAANDDFFAPKENLLKPEKPVWREKEYTDRGKWMDGWETRRRRTPGHDWCILRLGVPGILRGVVVDTSFFRGNYPEHCSLEACALEGTPGVDQLTNPETRWTEVLLKSALVGDAQNPFVIDDAHRFTHVRLRIYPDGGVARLRVHGEALPDWHRLLATAAEIDLAAAQHGARIVDCSDMFYSAPQNMLMPEKSAGMHDGWETKRRRGPGHDWAIVKLGIAGYIQRVEVDTSFFKGNFPESCTLEVCEAPDDAALPGVTWTEILHRTKLHADTQHAFDDQLVHGSAATHVRLNIFPDGGVARLRVFGTPTRLGRETQGLRLLNALLECDAAAALHNCCGASRWAKAMAETRPFASAEQLFHAAEKCFLELTREDWLESFRAHPRIGEKKAAASPAALAAAGWAEQEQAGARSADAATVTALAEANRAYETRFGHIFIICATGKTPAEMLAACKRRLANDAEKELSIATDEQRRITHLRLEKIIQL